MNLGLKSKLMRSPFEQSICTNIISTIVKTYVEFYVESWVEIIFNVYLSMFRLFRRSGSFPGNGHCFVMIK